MASPVSPLDALRERGFVQQVNEEPALVERLQSTRMTFYIGFDPTASSLHVGSLVPLMAMAHMARAGHRPIALLGGGTAMVGDPSGKTELRQMLTQETIQENRQGVEPQIRKFLVDAPDALVVDNAEWLLSLKYIEFLRDIGRHFSVNRMLTAESYRLRLERGLSFIEFNYQLLQAYDFLVLNRRYGCELQMGGDDQWGNILAGTDLIRRLERANAFGMTFPLLTTASGAKMGKTAEGAVWLDPARTRPYDFYQYFVNVDDRDVIRFLKLLTFLPLEEIKRYEALQGAELRTAKRALAHGVTEIIHGRVAADEAERGAQAVFGAGADNSANVPSVELNRADLVAGIRVVDVLASSGLAVSKSAARRLVEQGGVRVGDRKITDVDDIIREADLGETGTLLHAGKKHVRRLTRSQ